MKWFGAGSNKMSVSTRGTSIKLIAGSCCGPKQLLAGQGPAGRAGVAGGGGEGEGGGRGCTEAPGPGVGVGRVEKRQRELEI